MRYIVEYSIGDECTWWATETEPIIFDGDPEDIQIAFMLAITEAPPNANDVKFGGVIFTVSDFFARDYNGVEYYQPPSFYTVDEWFAKVEK